MEMHRVANLATFFPSKKAPKPYLVSENRWYCRASARSCFPSARIHLSLCASAQFLFSERRKHRYYVASSNFTCKYSWNHSTAIVFILCVFDFIRRRLDYQIFVQINILEGRAFLCSLNGLRFNHYFIFIPLSDNRKSKIYQWKQFYWEFSCIKIQYVGTERETNLIINVHICIFRRSELPCPAKM